MNPKYYTTPPDYDRFFNL